jgi:hypothetical protein
MGDAARRKRDFAKGYLLGLSGMPVVTAPAVASDPLYLYGGVALPPFPAEWDRVTYPYAVIVKRRPDLYVLSVYKSINYFESTFFGITEHYFGTQEDGTALVFTSRPGEIGWSQLEYTKFSIPVDRGNTMDVAIWTHGFDLMYSDDTLYVGASEPERITDWDALKGKYFYNDFIGPDVFGNNYLSNYYNSVIIKTEEAYILFELLHGFGDGSYFIVDDSTKKVYIKQSTISWHGASRMDFDSDVWGWADIEQYLGEEYERNGNKYWYVCESEDLIWSHDDIGYFDSSYTAFYGSEPIPVPVPEPAEVNTDNKAIVLGCRLGYIVRTQMQKGKADSVPDGVLISSDGYILKDSNGLYLCAMKGE